MKANRWKPAGITVASAAAVVFTILIALVALPELIDLNRYRGRIAGEIEKAVGGRVTLGNIEWSLISGISVSIEGVSVSGATGLSGDLTIGRIHGEVSVIPLVSKRVVIKTLRIESLNLLVRLHPSSGRAAPPEPAPAAPEPRTPPEAPLLPVKLMIKRLSLKNGRITVEEVKTMPTQKSVHTFTDVDIVATDLIPGQKVPFRFALKDAAGKGFGKLTGKGTFSGLTESLALKAAGVRLKARLSSLDVASIKPYMADNPWIQGLHGALFADVSFERDPKKGSSCQGVIDLSNTTYEDTETGEIIRPKVDTKIAYDLAFSDNRLNVKDFDLMWSNLSLRTSAVIEHLGKAPAIRDFELTADLPLKELAYIIPWEKMGRHADRIRKVVAGGGNITIEKASMPHIRLSRLIAHPETLLSDVQLTARFAGLSGRPLPGLPGMKDVEGMIRFKNGVIDIDGLTGLFGVTRLPMIMAKITGLPESPRVAAHLAGDFVVAAAKDGKTQRIWNAIGVERISGKGSMDLSMQLAFDKPEDMKINGKLLLRGFQLKTSLTPVSFENIDLEADIDADALKIAAGSLVVAIPGTDETPENRFKLAVRATVTDWRKRPRLTVKRLKTSDISLPSFTAILPRDVFGKNGDRIKDIFLAAGTIAVENLTTPPVGLTTPPKDMVALMNRSMARIRIADIDIQWSPDMPGIEGISGKLNLEKGVLSADRLSLRYGPIMLPQLIFRATHLFTQPKVAADLKGHIRFDRTPTPKLRSLLLDYGLKDVFGDMDISLKARYDHEKPAQWTAEGSFTIKDLSAVSHPGGVVMHRLNADLSFRRKKRLDIDIRKFSTRLNESPVHLSGRLSLKGTDAFFIDAEARVKDLDLTRLTAVSPTLRAMDLGLTGSVTLDSRVHLDSRNRGATKMTGTITTRGLGFDAKGAGLKVKGLNTKLDLRGDAIHINSMTASVNGQHLNLQGKVISPLVEPRADLKVKAADLNLDGLFPPVKKTSKNSEASLPAKAERKAESKKMASGNGNRAWKKPPLEFDRAVARIQVEIARLRFRGNTFQHVNFTADYRRGILNPFDLKLRYKKSELRAAGTLDLRNPAGIEFDVRPDIKGLPVQSLTPLFGIEKVPVHGPLTVSGHIRGKTGDRLTLLSSLNGDLGATIEQGTYLETGAATGLISKILSVTNVKSILTRGLLKDITSAGIPFDRIESTVKLFGGNLNIDTFHLASRAMNLRANGRVDLLKRHLDVDVLLEPFEIIDKALEFVPFAGRLGRKFTRYTVLVNGPVGAPAIRLGAVRKVTDTLKKEERRTKDFLRGFF